jgi:hypothetical protein
VGRGGAHAAGVAGRANTATLAREGDEQVSAAVTAASSEESVSVDAALEVRAQLLLDVAW